MSLADDTREITETALEQIRCLTEELAAVTTDRDRQENFRVLFQGQAMKYRNRYHETLETLYRERIEHSQHTRE